MLAPATFFQPAIGGDRAALQAQSIGRFDSPIGPRFDGVCRNLPARSATHRLRLGDLFVWRVGHRTEGIRTARVASAGGVRREWQYASLLDGCKLFSRYHARHDRLALVYRVVRIATDLIWLERRAPQQMSHQQDTRRPGYHHP